MDSTKDYRRVAQYSFISTFAKTYTQFKLLTIVTLFSLPIHLKGQCAPDITPPTLTCPADVTAACDAIPAVANSFDEFTGLFDASATTTCCTDGAIEIYLRCKSQRWPL